jgi:hypothetical protein
VAIHEELLPRFPGSEQIPVFKAMPPVEASDPISAVMGIAMEGLTNKWADIYPSGFWPHSVYDSAAASTVPA